MINALAIFTDECEHWLAPRLKPGFRHVWCIVQDERGYWLSHNWLRGYVSIRAEFSGTWEDIAQHYAAKGFRVLGLEAGPMMQPPIIFNNCVGHTKTVLGVGGVALTPYALYKRLKEKHRAVEVEHADDAARYGRGHSRSAASASAAAPAASAG